MCYNYSNLQSVIINGSYDLWVSSKSIHQSKPRLQVTNTRDNIYILQLAGVDNESYKMKDPSAIQHSAFRT
jgi:hypothetical protein